MVVMFISVVQWLDGYGGLVVCCGSQGPAFPNLLISSVPRSGFHFYLVIVVVIVIEK